MKTNSMVKDSVNMEYSEHAFWVLKVGFIVAPILAGLDKFFNVLTNWTNYLAPVFPEMINVTPQAFMQGVGVVEMIVGIGVFFKPKIFSYILSAWLVGIIINLLVLGGYYDVALRDLGLAIGAFALGQLSEVHERGFSSKEGRVKSNRPLAAS